MDGPSQRWRRLFNAEPKREVDEELAFHLEERAKQNIASGLDAAAARAAALARFGDVTSVRDECAELLRTERRAAERRDWLGDVRQDLRFGVRTLMRAPVFSVMAMLTLALGIGANAAVFGVAKSVLLDALPYDDADRLVRVYGRLADGTMDRTTVSAAAFTDIAERQRSFSRMTAFFHGTYDVTHHGAQGPRVLFAALVDIGFFATLGVDASVGRVFTDADVAQQRAVVLLTHRAWQREFGGERSVLGKMMRIDSDAYEVVGVLPREFVPPMGEADVFFPQDVSAALRDPVRARNRHWLGVIARLRRGVGIEAAHQEQLAIRAVLAREYPDSDSAVTATTLSLRTAMAGETRLPLLVLLASAGLVLLITCANLAGALLSRTIGRRKEFALRTALGAGRGRLMRQLLTETMVLAIGGGVIGLGLASLALSALRALNLPMLPSYANLSLDPGALFVTALLSICTGIAFGVGPAFSVPRGNTQATLRDDSRSVSESNRSRRLRGLLVAGQVALSISLLVGAALLTRSLWALTAAPLGYQPDGLLTVALKGPVGVSDAKRRQFFDEVDARARTLAGVTAVASTSELPLPNVNRNGLAIRGVNWAATDGQPFIATFTVSDDYFRTMRIPLQSGRTFNQTDRADAPTAIVISEGMAQRYWPNGDAVGAHIRLGPDPNAPWSQVVGIVGDVRNDPARTTPEPMAYVSSRQDLLRSTRTFLVRTSGDPLALLGAFERELRVIDPTQAIANAAALDQTLADGLVTRKLPVVLIGGFGALAVLLASIGVYALFANMVAAREREFGVRIALGSNPRAIAGLVLRQGAYWLMAGLLLGLVGVFIVGRALRGLLIEVTPFDPLALGAATAILVASAICALLVPVRRATRVDPMAVLR